jgi:hypothetical protein
MNTPIAHAAPQHGSLTGKPAGTRNAVEYAGLARRTPFGSRLRSQVPVSRLLRKR